MILYHYCSIENFHKLIESKSIWLSNSSQMNDSKETLWVDNYFDFLLEIFDKNELEEFKRYTIYTYNLNKNDTYIFCLSKEKDTLSQWRAYSNDGKGVCIGFDLTLINIPQELPTRNKYLDSTIGISEVIYNELQQKEMIISLANEYIEYSKNGQYGAAFSSTMLGFFLVNYSLIFKNPSFEEEKEYRIIHTPLEDVSQYIAVDEKKFDISEIKFRVSGNRLTSYSILNIEKDFNSILIPEIILGPKCEIDEKILKSFLNHNNLKDTKIFRSKSTYR